MSLPFALYCRSSNSAFFSMDCGVGCSVGVSFFWGGWFCEKGAETNGVGCLQRKGDGGNGGAAHTTFCLDLSILPLRVSKVRFSFLYSAKHTHSTHSPRHSTSYARAQVDDPV